MWFLFIQKPENWTDLFVRDFPSFYSAVICKGLFYVNLASFFLSELIICTISFHRVLAVFFPLKIILLSSKYPRLFTILFLCIVGLALMMPFSNLIFNSNVDMESTINIAEKNNLSQYCYVHSLAGKF